MGIIRATAEIGPKPGNIPIKVPEKQPTTTIKILNGAMAVSKPAKIPSHIVYSP
jgi:hypothetical protein